MLSNAYFLAKFRFDTAENEPAKNLQNFRKMHFRKMQFLGGVPEGTPIDIIAHSNGGRCFLTLLAERPDVRLTIGDF